MPDMSKIAAALASANSKSKQKRIAVQAKGAAEEGSSLDFAIDEYVEAMSSGDKKAQKSALKSVLQIAKDSE